MARARAVPYHLLLLDALVDKLSEEHVKRQILVHVQDAPIAPRVQLCLDLVVPA